MQSIIDTVINGDMAGFKKVLVATLLYAILIGVFNFLYNILSKVFMRNVSKELRSKVFSGIFRCNYKDFTSINTADYISVLTNDIKLIEENYLLPLLLVFQFSVMFIGTVGVLLWFSPLVTICLFGSTVLMFIVPSIFGKVLENKQLALSKKLTSFTSKIKDMLLGYEVIKSYNLNKNIINDFEDENSFLASTKFAADKILVINETLSQFFGLGTQFVAMFLSAYLVIKGDLTMGMLIAIIQLSGTFVQPIIMIMSNIPKVTGMKAVLKRIDNFSNYEDKSFNGKVKPTFENNLEVKDLSFAYDDKKNNINSINLTLEKNKKYAIVGPSGCGKSTLIKLLLAYYSNYHGEIKFDDKSVKGLDIESLNKIISIINQNVYMFDKTIKDNITLYDNFKNEEIDHALKLSGADSFINELENGLDSHVGENGNRLSGGQRQRIAIARALIQKKPILVLDEGTSAIDMQTGYDIENRLLNVENLTLITITHKMSEELLKSYDEIIFMENGTIVEKGNLNKLLENKSKFFEFYNLETNLIS